MAPTVAYHAVVWADDRLTATSISMAVWYRPEYFFSLIANTATDATTCIEAQAMKGNA